MENILAEILTNLEKVGLGVAIFILMYLSNVLTGIWYNVKVIGCKFRWKRIANSALKVLFVGFAIVFLCVGITLVIPWINYAGLTIPEEFNDVISVIALCGIALKGIVTYGKDTLQKLNLIFNPTSNEQ